MRLSLSAGRAAQPRGLTGTVVLVSGTLQFVALPFRQAVASSVSATCHLAMSYSKSLKTPWDGWQDAGNMGTLSPSQVGSRVNRTALHLTAQHCTAHLLS